MPMPFSKALGENICDALVARCDATAVSIRLSLVLAPQDYKDLVPMLQRSAASASFNYWSYVDVEDVADLIVKTVEAKTPGHEVIYAAQPANIAGRLFLELLNELLPSGAPVVRALSREDAGGVNIDKAAAFLDGTQNVPGAITPKTVHGHASLSRRTCADTPFILPTSSSTMKYDQFVIKTQKGTCTDECYRHYFNSVGSYSSNW